MKPIAKGKKPKTVAGITFDHLHTVKPPARRRCPIFGCYAKLIKEDIGGVEVIACPSCNWGGGTTKAYPLKFKPQKKRKTPRKGKR